MCQLGGPGKLTLSIETLLEYFRVRVLGDRIITQRVSNQRVSTQRVSNPKGLELRDMGFVSGSPETVLLPRWSTFLVQTSFLSPKGAGLWTVDWQFQKSGFPQSYQTNVLMQCANAMCSCPQLPRRMVCLTCIVYLLCLPGVHSISELSKPPP